MSSKTAAARAEVEEKTEFSVILKEAGASKYESKKENRHNLAREAVGFGAMSREGEDEAQHERGVRAQRVVHLAFVAEEIRLQQRHANRLACRCLLPPR